MSYRRRTSSKSRPSLDKQNSLARHIVCALPLYEGAGTVARDIKTHGQFSFSGSPTWVPGGLDLDGSDYIYSSAFPDALFLGPISIFIVAKIDTGSAFRHFAGKHAGNGSTNNPFDFRTSNAATPTLYLSRATATNIAQPLTTTPSVILGQKASYGVSSSQVGGTARFYVNGKGTTVSMDTARGPATGSGADLRIGRRADGVVQMDGTIYRAMFFNWVLTDSEFAELHSNPNYLWGPPSRRLPSIGAADSGGGIVVPALAGNMLTGGLLSMSGGL